MFRRPCRRCLLRQLADGLELALQIASDGAFVGVEHQCVSGAIERDHELLEAVEGRLSATAFVALDWVTWMPVASAGLLAQASGAAVLDESAGEAMRRNPGKGIFVLMGSWARDAACRVRGLGRELGTAEETIASDLSALVLALERYRRAAIRGALDC
jgi:hypothetical protein